MPTPQGGLSHARPLTRTAGDATNPNANVGIHYKQVNPGSTGTQLVDSNDAVNRTWAGVGFLLQPRLMRPVRSGRE